MVTKVMIVHLDQLVYHKTSTKSKKTKLLKTQLSNNRNMNQNGSPDRFYSKSQNEWQSIDKKWG